MQVTGKRILVVGMARSGIAVAKLLCKAGATPILNDSKEEASFGQTLDELRSLPCQWRLGRPAMELLDGRRDRELLSNILYFGLPAVLHAVAEGTFRKAGNRRKT